MPAPLNRLKQALAEGQQTIGCGLVLGDSYAAEIAAGAGFD
jgi:2-keto-3-deoxy-L-rhamnonate aldolase RhmA